MTKLLYDAKCLFSITNENMLVPWYLMAAYAYYEEDDPIISDSLFDRICKSILDNWDSIQHYHKKYLSKEMLEAGTYIGDYPSIVAGAVRNIRSKGANQ